MFESQRSSIPIDTRHMFAQKGSLGLLRPNNFKCALLALSIGAAGAVSAQSVYPDNSSPTVQQFNSTSGEYQKREYLAALMRTNESSVQSAPAKAVSDNLSSILSAALTEDSPIVVEQAMNVIGAQHQTSFVNQLLLTYANADKRFGGYGERVRLAAISTLGAIGGHDASPLFADILSKEKASVLAEKTLLAIQAAGDKSLARDVDNFAQKMNAIVDLGKKSGSNPLLYSQAMNIAQLAGIVLLNLSK
jgi:hypothetical protein